MYVDVPVRAAGGAQTVVHFQDSTGTQYAYENLDVPNFEDTAWVPPTMEKVCPASACRAHPSLHPGAADPRGRYRWRLCVVTCAACMVSCDVSW